MSSQLHDLKISSFLDSFYLNRKISKTNKNHKFIKKASTNWFEGADSPENLAKKSKIFYDIIHTGDFDDLKNKLKQSVGVVNFITGGQDLLAEVLLKDTFPPNSNDVYNMGTETTTGDYSIDVRNTFKMEPNIQLGQDRLHQILFGSPMVMTKKWLADNLELSESEIEDTVEAYGIAEPLALYEQLQSQMQKYNRVLTDNIAKRKELKRTIKRTNDLIESKEVAAEAKKLLKDNLVDYEKQEEELEKKFVNIRAFYGGLASRALRIANQSLNPSDYFGGSPLYNKDGFIHFDPIADIEDIKTELVDSIDNNKPLNETIQQVSLLISKLNSYRTTDPVLNKKKEQIFKFFNINPEEYFEAGGEDQTKAIEAAARKVRGNQKFEWLNYQQEFYERGSQHGKLMILKNFENSMFCVPPGAQASSPNYTLASGKPLHDFNVANRKDITGVSSSKKGNRTIIIVSEHPINRLESIKIDLSLKPVTLEQAEVIVNDMVNSYGRKAFELTLIKALSDVSANTSNLSNTDQQKLLGKTQQDVVSRRSTLGQLDVDTKDQLQQMIIGLSQSNAIDTIEMSLIGGLQVEKDDNDRIISLKFDPKKVLVSARDRLNEIAQDIGFGFTPDKPSIKYSEYAYKKSSAWADKVKSVGDKAKAIAYAQGCIMSRMQRIDFANSKLMNQKLSEKTRKELLDKIEEWSAEIEGLRSDIASHKVNLPHVCILYGPPGVGKSVWADAMGDLFKCLVRNVDLSSAKSKWYGETEQQTAKLFRSMLSSRNTVFLVDELDRQLGMAGESGGPSGGGSAGQEHQVDRAVVKQLLDLFETPDNFQKMLDNNIFVVITTNYLGNIDTAMMSRIVEKGGSYKVELPDDPEAYKKLLIHFLKVEQRRFPKYPLFCPSRPQRDENGNIIPKNIDICWEFTFKKLQEMGTPTDPGQPSSLDKICKVLASQKIDFRLTKALFKELWSAHQDYVDSLSAIGRGDERIPSGLPFTVENVIAAASEAKTAVDGHDMEGTGVSDVKRRRQEEINKALEGVDVPIEEFYDEEKKETRERVNFNSLPQILDIMNGKMDVEETIDQINIEEEITEHPETGEKKSYPVIKMSPQEEMEKMREDVFDTVEPGKEKSKEKEKEKVPEEQKEEEEPLTSSTDYFYNRLKKEGILASDGKSIKQKEKIAQIQMVQEESPNEEGIYWFAHGILVAPGNESAPPQFLNLNVSKNLGNTLK